MVFRKLLLATMVALSLPAGAATVTGTVLYLERMALPPEAVLEVRVEDVSLADAPARTIGVSTMPNAGQVPIPFSVTYEPADVQPGHSYAVRATIRVGESLWFTTTQMHPVLPNSTQTDAGTIRVERVHAEPPRSDRPLVNTYWRLVTLDGQPVKFEGPGREPHLLLHVDGKRATGSGGCNTYSGTYQADGKKLSISSVASTMMACVKGMENESAFYAALAATQGYRIAGESLTLTGSAGKVLATLHAVDF